MTIELTNIWKINNTLVVADSIEDAIVIYKTKYGNCSINCIEKVTHSGNGCAIMNDNTSEELESFIEKACKWLLSQEEMIGISFENDFIERFKKVMEE